VPPTRRNAICSHQKLFLTPPCSMFDYMVCNLPLRALAVSFLSGNNRFFAGGAQVLRPNEKGARHGAKNRKRVQRAGEHRRGWRQTHFQGGNYCILQQEPRCAGSAGRCLSGAAVRLPHHQPLAHCYQSKPAFQAAHPALLAPTFPNISLSSGC